MAEIGLIASVIGIAGFAVSVSKKLYEFSATTSAAGEEIDFVASNINNYANALELLAERLESDGDDPIFSARVVSTVAGLYEQSCNLFDDIEEMIPAPKPGRDNLSFMQKISWNFKKSKVDFLTKQIECLKSTVNLVAQVLFAGKKVRSRRRLHRTRRRHHSSRFDDEQLDRARQKVEVAAIEQVQTFDQLGQLHRGATEEARPALQNAQSDNDKDLVSNRMSENSVQLFNNLSSVLPAHVTSTKGTVNQKRLILNQAADVFQHLLQQFTTVLDDHDIRDEDKKDPAPTTGGKSSSDDGRQRSPGLQSGSHPEEVDSNIKESLAPPQNTRNRENTRKSPVPSQRSAFTSPEIRLQERAHEVQRETPGTGPYLYGRDRPTAPALSRSETMSTDKSVQEDTDPARGSKIRRSETKNSGYRTGSNKLFGEVPSSEESADYPTKYVYTPSVKTTTYPSPRQTSPPARQSTPTNLAPHVINRVPDRGRQSSSMAAPGLSRSQTMPIKKSPRRDPAPRGSNLKHSETQDSGYYSSSNPQVPEMKGDSGYYSRSSRRAPEVTQDSGYYSGSDLHVPEMKGDSPPPARENRRKTNASTKYQIITPGSDDDDDSRVARVRVQDSDRDRR